MGYLMYWNEKKQQYENPENYTVAQPERNFAILPRYRAEEDYTIIPVNVGNRRITKVQTTSEKIEEFFFELGAAFWEIEKALFFFGLRFFVAYSEEKAAMEKETAMKRK